MSNKSQERAKFSPHPLKEEGCLGSSLSFPWFVRVRFGYRAVLVIGGKGSYVSGQLRFA